MYNDIIINKIKSNGYDKKGNLSSTRLKKIENDIINNTLFLNDYNPSLAERVYCILNNITVIQYCPLTNVKLKYSNIHKKYLNSVKYSQSNKIIKNPANHKKRNLEYIKQLFDYYNNDDYNLIDKTDCINQIQKLKLNITPAVAINNIDLVCSVLHHTPFIKSDKLDITERVFCIQNGIDSHPIDDNGNLLQFINRYQGYSKHANKEEYRKDQIEKIENQIQQKFKINGYILSDVGGKSNQKYRIDVDCIDCGYNFQPLYHSNGWKNIYCSNCNGYANRSKAEDEIIQYIQTIIDTAIISNDRSILSGLELDIYLPEYKLAIEYCGILWHSFGTTYPNNQYIEKENKNNHRNKFDRCKSQGIELLTIFDNEWEQKKDIVKSIIRHKLKQTKNTLYARKCEYRIVDKETATRFLDRNHIQGISKFSDAHGLYYNDELVSLMCFGRRKISKGEVKEELIRFCNKLETNVVGGASKILKHSNKTNFISYCDLRYSRGVLYDTLGMKLIRTSKPNYWYTNDNSRLYHRSNFQKHKIQNDYNMNDPEWQIMFDRGYRRIYDCGNLVFEYRKE